MIDAPSLVSCTMRNPALPDANCPSDVDTIDNGKSTFQSNLIEYAARVCYKSTGRMGTSPNFVASRVREGHEDVIEHVHVVLKFPDTSENKYIAGIGDFNKHIQVNNLGRTYGWLVSGNLRAWKTLLDAGKCEMARPLLQGISPEIFEGVNAEFPFLNRSHPGFGFNHEYLHPATDSETGWGVVLLGFTQPRFGFEGHHGAATFLVEGISRACSHQFVRHRLASFSQESQRYVDMKKGNWDVVVPPKIQNNKKARSIYHNFWCEQKDVYRRLRSEGIRKEDARFILSTAVETRMVVTMPFAAWKHFVKLRALDKAAQWEIRQVGQAILKNLYGVAPVYFHHEYGRLTDLQGVC